MLQGQSPRVMQPSAASGVAGGYTRNPAARPSDLRADDCRAPDKVLQASCCWCASARLEAHSGPSSISRRPAVRAARARHRHACAAPARRTDDTALAGQAHAQGCGRGAEDVSRTIGNSPGRSRQIAHQPGDRDRVGRRSAQARAASRCGLDPEPKATSRTSASRAAERSGTQGEVPRPENGDVFLSSGH